MRESCIPDFYKLSLPERHAKLRSLDLISEKERKALSSGEYSLPASSADLMIENAIGVFSLPLGLALNFTVNGRDYVVPMAVEEPSVIAAVSSAAKLAGENGGFVCRSESSHLIGQIQLVECEDPARAVLEIYKAQDELLCQANSLHPSLVSRGGGAKELEVHCLPGKDRKHNMVVVHLLVDTCDAMGANIVNSMCESAAPLAARLARGRPLLRILSNLADRALVTAEVHFSPETLAYKGYSGDAVSDGILLASEFAEVDPYRAATHNKGIMNGIDAVAIATGNDWRAIEAGAHAYAAKNSRYTALATWEAAPGGRLRGILRMPLKAGTVGAQINANPTVRLTQRILGVKSARELSEVMAAVGLAQNFAALRALATEGISRGHMKFHARCAAFSNGSGQASPSGSPQRSSLVTANAKVILLGEHAVLHGSHALALSIPEAVHCAVQQSMAPGIVVSIPNWHTKEKLCNGTRPTHSLLIALEEMLSQLGLSNASFSVTIDTNIPPARGLGSSAAISFAVLSAVSQSFDLKLRSSEQSEILNLCEDKVHDSASGIDAAAVKQEGLILFRRGRPPLMETVSAPIPLYFVVGVTQEKRCTAKMVQLVNALHSSGNGKDVFGKIDELVLQACAALKTGDIKHTGYLMCENHELLTSLGISTPALDLLVKRVMEAGALGAKLTGAGGGGSMVALARNEKEAEVIAKALAADKVLVIIRTL